MAQILFRIDDIQDLPQPDRMMWSPPVLLGHALNGSPTYGPYWSADLSWHKLYCPAFSVWLVNADGILKEVWLPMPGTGEMTMYESYIELMSPRFNTDDLCGYGPAISGIDIRVSRIAL